MSGGIIVSSAINRNSYITASPLKKDDSFYEVLKVQKGRNPWVKYDQIILDTKKLIVNKAKEKNKEIMNKEKRPASTLEKQDNIDNQYRIIFMQYNHFRLEDDAGKIDSSDSLKKWLEQSILDL